MVFALPGCKLANRGGADLTAAQLSNTRLASAPVALTPRQPWVLAGQSLNFTAQGGNPPLTFSVVSTGNPDPGTIDARTGIFTAPRVAGSTVIRATDSSGLLGDQTEVTVTEKLTLRKPAVLLTPNTLDQHGNTHTIAATGGGGTLTCEPVGLLTGTLQGCTYTAPLLTTANANVTLTEKVRVSAPLPGQMGPIDPALQGDVTFTVGPRIACSNPCSRLSAGEKCQLSASQGVPFDAASGNPPYLFQLESGQGSLNPATGVYTAPSWIPATGAKATIRVYDQFYNSCTTTVTVRTDLAVTPASWVTHRSPAQGEALKQTFLITGGKRGTCLFPPTGSLQDCAPYQGPYDITVVDSWMQARAKPIAPVTLDQYNLFYTSRYGADSGRSGGSFSVIQPGASSTQFLLTYTAPKLLPLDDAGKDLGTLTLTLSIGDAVGARRLVTIRASDFMQMTPTQLTARIAQPGSAATEFTVDNGIPPYSAKLCAGSEDFGSVAPVPSKPGTFRWTPPKLAAFRPAAPDSTGKSSFQLARDWSLAGHSATICVEDQGTHPQSLQVQVDRGPLVLGSTGNDELVAVVNDSQDNLYVVGMTNASDGSFDGLSSHGKRDVFVLKVTADGKPSWRAVLGTETDEVAQSAALHENGSTRLLYLVGNTQSRLATGGCTASVEGLLLSPEPGNMPDATPIPGMTTTCSGTGASGAFLVKLDLAAADRSTSGGGLAVPRSAFQGKFLQPNDLRGVEDVAADVGTLVGPPELLSHEISAVAVDRSGNVYAAGKTTHRYTVLPKGATTTRTQDFSDAFVISLTSGLSYRWGPQSTNKGADPSLGRVLGNSLADDSATSVAVNGDSVYVSGTTSSPAFTTDEKLGGYSESHGGADLFVAAFSITGAPIWQTKLGNTGNDAGGPVAVSGDGAEILGTGQVSPIPQGAQDVFKNAGSAAPAAVGFTLASKKTSRDWQGQLQELSALLTDASGVPGLNRALPRALAWRERRPAPTDPQSPEFREPDRYTTVDAQLSTGSRQRAFVHCAGATGPRCSPTAAASGIEIAISSGPAAGTFGTSLRGLAVLKGAQHPLILGGHMDGTLLDGSSTTGVRAGHSGPDTDLFLLQLDMNLDPQ